VSESRYALITGASSGIGECFARALAARGLNLVLVARSREKLEALAAGLRAAHSVRIEVMPCDLSLPSAAQRLARELQDRQLSIELLINNAGFGAHGEFWKLPLDRQAEMLRLNVAALVELTHHLVPSMVERRSGAIINVSSTASFQPVAYTTLYAATKAFVTSFSMALAEELRPYRIAVVTLCPGSTRTNFFVAGDYQRKSLPGGAQAPEEVVRDALRVLDRGGGLVVPRFLNKLSVAIERLVPRGVVAWFAARVFRP